MRLTRFVSMRLARFVKFASYGPSRSFANPSRATRKGFFATYRSKGGEITSLLLFSLSFLALNALQEMIKHSNFMKLRILITEYDPC